MTSRLILSPLVRGDADELFLVRGDTEAMTYWDWPPDKDRAATAAVVDAMLRDVVSGEACFWTLRLRIDARFVGLCDLSDIVANQSCEIGFLLAREFWDIGLAKEAIACLLAQARALALQSVHARIHSQNERSARLLARAGFREVLSMPDLEIRPGVRRNCKRFDLALDRTRVRKELPHA